MMKERIVQEKPYPDGIIHAAYENEGVGLWLRLFDVGIHVDIMLNNEGLPDMLLG